MSTMQGGKWLNDEVSLDSLKTVEIVLIANFWDVVI